MGIEMIQRDFDGVAAFWYFDTSILHVHIEAQCVRYATEISNVI
jgi:hypothetical protein